MQFFSQDRAPVLEALEKFKTMRIVPFDVPGHKRGRGNPELTEFLGEDCLSVDVNSMNMLDNPATPIAVSGMRRAGVGSLWPPLPFQC